MPCLSWGLFTLAGGKRTLPGPRPDLGGPFGGSFLDLQKLPPSPAQTERHEGRPPQISRIFSP